MNMNKKPRSYDKLWFDTEIDGEWTKSLSDVPCISEAEVVDFLLHRRSPSDKVYDASSWKHAKPVKAVKFVNDGHVQKIFVCKARSEHSVVVRASVLASMKQTHYKVFAAVTLDGQALGAYCECVAGKGQSCNHVAATLFAVSRYKREGLDTVPADKTCTEVKCRWKRHAAKKTAPAALDDIKIVKYASGEDKLSRSTLHCLDFDPRSPDARKRDQEVFNNLYQPLKATYPELGFSRYAVPAPSIPDSDCEKVHHGDSSLVHPVSLLELRSACQRMKTSLQLPPQEADDLERKTRGQSSSQAWHEGRRLRLTASIFHQVINMRKTTCPSKFLLQQLYAESRHQTKAMKLGLAREDGAAQRYKLQKQLEGEELTLSEVGLRIADNGFLGASVDRIATDPSGKRILVELKNPDNTWEFKDVLEIPTKQNCLVKTTCGQKVQLNRKHSYFTQVQGQLYVYNCQFCDFVLCTRHTMYIERISRDEAFITNMVAKLEAFYDNIYLPEIVYPRVKSGALPLDLKNYD